MAKSVISCDLHDYLEIACMYKMPVEFLLDDQSRLECTPITTLIDASLGECLRIQTGTDVSELLQVAKIKQMKALQDNPHFSTVIFTK